MAFEIAQRVVYGTAGTTAVMAAIAIAVGVSAIAVCNPATYVVGVVLGLSAPKFAR